MVDGNTDTRATPSRVVAVTPWLCIAADRAVTRPCVGRSTTMPARSAGSRLDATSSPNSSAIVEHALDAVGDPLLHGGDADRGEALERHREPGLRDRVDAGHLEAGGPRTHRRDLVWASRTCRAGRTVPDGSGSGHGR